MDIYFLLYQEHISVSIHEPVASTSKNQITEKRVNLKSLVDHTFAY
jgi:hypothetical protein